MAQRSSVAVVILNWNGRNYLERFLPSVLSSKYERYTVYVADNASTDDSVAFLKQQFPSVKILINSHNDGFAGGYNWALQFISEDITVLLNSDVEVDQNWLEPAVKLFEDNENLAAVQPKIIDYNNKSRFEYAGACGGWIDKYGYPFSKGRIFDELEMDHGQYDQSEPIFWASGAAMFVRTEVFKKCNGFDYFFFAHQEEIDLCWRMQLAGFQIQSCPQSVVFHIGGGTLSKDNPRKVFLNFRNNLIMLFKNLQGFDRIYILLIRFALDAISAWKSLIQGKSVYFTAIAKAHVAFFGWILFHQKESVFPIKNDGTIQGKFNGNIVWQHFVLGKKRFSEIIGPKK